MGDPDVRGALLEALLALNTPRCEELLDEALAAGSLLTVADRLLAPCLEDIGARWERGELALSQVYMGARICERWVTAHPAEVAPPRSLRLATALLHDRHALGLQIVTLVLRSAGYQPVALGAGSAEELHARAKQAGVEVLLVSTLMLASALRVRELRALIDGDGGPYKLVVGGAPFRFDSQLADEVGADAAGGSATDALRILRELEGQLAGQREGQR
jgi:methanogenic corrinoid protein MtbC1